MGTVRIQTFATMLGGVLCALGIEVASAERLIFESENADRIEAPLRRVEKDAPRDGHAFLEDASGEAYLQIPQGSGNPPKVPEGKAVYTLEVGESGRYVLWCRVYWEDECGNSLNVQLEDGPVFAIGQDAVYKRWHWVRSPPRLPLLRLEPGTYRLTLGNREDGVAVDQVALSNERRFVPMGIQPVPADTE